MPGHEEKQQPKTQEDELIGVLFTLKTVQVQMRKLLKYQESSYAFHVQHHSNLKKIIASVNQLGRCLNGQGTPDIRIDIVEDPQLLSGFPSLTTEPKMARPLVDDSLHSFLLNHRDNITSKQVADRILSTMTASSFQQLNEESIQVLIPLMALWLKSRPGNQLAFALVALYESMKNFPNAFLRVNATVLTSCIEVLEGKIREAWSGGGSVPLSIDELEYMRDFLRRL
ncbi:hypothetical protein PROFUN_09194 [Planoprotostelium fungivorum]|uniref:Uncharacterized protein n=1 Tax=Planoprotostelium fungivorum TaxID=1890364 RepID=A0A2P6NHK7_9EUKA|nr:hypothetical protein PROFUN_13903 [Planoprotostelium fungivorum]PRP83421.1 hypothetical protein PROFUN_09194 [Planoprotostelium fungivorum]